MSNLIDFVIVIDPKTSIVCYFKNIQIMENIYICLISIVIWFEWSVFW